jgi:anthranilate 1,2-dioxygenase small subunit
MSQSDISPVALRDAAEDLMTEYAELIDSDRLEEWLRLFAEESVYQILSRENEDLGLPAPLMLCANKNMLRDRVVALRNANEYNIHYDRHLISGVRIRPAQGRLYNLHASYVVYQTSQEGQSSLFSVGRYRDKVRLEGGKLVFVEKTVIVDTFSVTPLLATPL